jgi:hypothetical protein
MNLSVDNHRGSVGLMNLTKGARKQEASKVVPPWSGQSFAFPEFVMNLMVNFVAHLYPAFNCRQTPIHNLQRFAGLQLFATIFQPLNERFGFRFETEPAESVQGKTSVPDPGVTIVPVSLTADLLRQTESRRK